MSEGRRAIELLPVEKDTINGGRIIVYLAMIAAWVGDNDLACEQLAAAIRHPTGPSYGQLKLLPSWDPLRGDPCFEKIVASLAPKCNLTTDCTDNTDGWGVRRSLLVRSACFLLNSSLLIRDIATSSAGSVQGFPHFPRNAAREFYEVHHVKGTE